MRLVAVLLACLVVAVFAPAAQAQTAVSGIYKTGEQMLALCESTRPADGAQCDSFLTGAQDSFVYLQDIGQIDREICVPAGTTATALRKVAIDYWRANPGSRRFSAVSSFWNALVARYPAPCV